MTPSLRRLPRCKNRISRCCVCVSGRRRATKRLRRPWKWLAPRPPRHSVGGQSGPYSRHYEGKMDANDVSPAVRQLLDDYEQSLDARALPRANPLLLDLSPAELDELLEMED